LVLNWIEDLEYELIKITLTCSEEELKVRLIKDVNENIREPKLCRVKQFQTDNILLRNIIFTLLGGVTHE
jgi:hypothetical protein